jgi:HEAT repeat protein
MEMAADPEQKNLDRDRAAVVTVFGTTASPGLDALQRLLADARLDVKLAGIVGCALRATTEKQPVLVERLEAIVTSDAEHELARAMAAWSLGEQKVEESVPVLVQFIEKREPGNLGAIHALRAIGSPEALAALKRVASGDGFTPEQAAVAARALQKSKP